MQDSLWKAVRIFTTGKIERTADRSHYCAVPFFMNVRRICILGGVMTANNIVDRLDGEKVEKKPLS